jgi:Leucine Rich Repeat (LRR) protein
MERGDPRGELIALMCELERAEAADARPARIRPLRERVRALIAAHHGDWLGPLFEICAGYYELRRGFVEHVRIMQDDVPAERLRDTAPLVREVSVPAEHGGELVRLAAALALTHVTIDGGDAEALAAARLDQLRALDIARCTLDPMATVARLELVRLEHLGLHCPADGPLAVTGALAGALERVASHRLRSFAVGPVVALAPAVLPPLERLCRLTVTGHITDPRALAEVAPQLESFGVIDSRAPLHLVDLVAALPALRHLRVVGSRVADVAAIAIARAAPRLTRLDLSHNQLTPDGARRVIELLPELVELRLRDNAFEPEALDGLRVERADELELVL